MSIKFQWLKQIIKRDINSQTFQEKETFFNFVVDFQKYSFNHFNVIYIIKLCDQPRGKDAQEYGDSIFSGQY